MKRVIVAISGAMLFGAAAVSPAFAAHTHNLDTPSDAAPVLAAGFCQDPAVTGFTQFHSRVHAQNGLDGPMDASGQVEITGINQCN